MKKRLYLITNTNTNTLYNHYHDFLLFFLFINFLFFHHFSCDFDLLLHVSDYGF